MKKIAKIASPLKWPNQKPGLVPHFYAFTDLQRLPNPTLIFSTLPRGSAIILRDFDQQRLKIQASRIIPLAHRMGIKVLIAGDPRIAILTKADGVHLSEKNARKGPLRFSRRGCKFIITAAAHSSIAIWRAKTAGAQGIFVSPIFETLSHPLLKFKSHPSHAHSPMRVPLGLMRFLTYARLHQHTTPKLMALGGVNHKNIKRLNIKTVYGLGAIGAWQD